MMESCHWTPAQCASVPLVVQVALWAERGAGKGGAPMTREEQMAALNQRRAKKGLPPLTEEEAAENERRFLAATRKGVPRG